MDTLNLYTKIYAFQRNYQGIPFWVLSPFRRLTRICANKVLPIYLKKNYEQEKSYKTEVIVSFTSFPARISNAWQVVECMFRQTYHPKKIILWLSKDQFPNEQSIPESLRKRENSIFEIRMVNGDIRSHKKYYYAAKEFPDSLIFLIDDDLYYPTNIIERSIKAHENNPNTVICNYGYFIEYDKNGLCKSYSDWTLCQKINKGKNLFFGSGGGTLFIPQLLYKDLTNINLALGLSPTADDIWLNTMCQLSKLDIIILSNGPILPIKQEQEINLCSINVNQNVNDLQISKVCNYYFERLKIKLFYK